MAQLRQAVVQHGSYQSVNIVAPQIFHVILLFVRCGIALLIEMAQHDRLFGVLLDIYNHRIVVVDWIVLPLGSILGHRNRREKLLDFLLHLIHVDIAHHYNSLQVRTIPLVIIVAQILIREVVDHIHRTNGHAVLVLGAAIHLWQRQLHHSLYGTSGTTCAPHFMNHASFLVYLFVFEQQIVTPVVQDEQTRVDNALTLQRHC